jgi:cobalt-precorrin 5A hydrolase
MDLDQAEFDSAGGRMIVAGVGCRRGAAAREVAAAVETALARAGISPAELALMATSVRKQSEAGIVQAAGALGVPLVIVPQADLEAAGRRVVTASTRVMAVAGVGSVAEAAALAAAGTEARLLAPRVAVGPAACALACTGTRGGAP